MHQGCQLSPALFNIFPERIMTKVLEHHEGTVSIGGRPLTNLLFVNGINGLAGEGEELATLTERLDKAKLTERCKTDRKIRQGKTNRTIYKTDRTIRQEFLRLWNGNKYT
ncbi:endonuclease-reverse transcriptase [Plakobranchus ocellatus]|uniref:Endonuclease-reverse transcriptase n=1 Tax=Plakobranchus ocellatus TaxID=259542 RepID=A0AAV4CVB7_9GAST|nr:endonuclease-reverse transcriptase [Plakobranchus ocellatus]